jgi:nucleotide-binding universal stress UspA family protein
MKTILVPAGGGDTDEVVFESALALAKPLHAHLEFLHVTIAAGEAAANTPHLAFARGAALGNVLDVLTGQCHARARNAERNVLAFCRLSAIELRDKPCASAAVTAHYRVEQGDAMRRLLFHARHNDLVVMARATKSDGLPSDRLETLLLQSGRPLLIAAAKASRSLLRTVMICWKETPQAARAVSAALPLLVKAERVVVANVEEGSDSSEQGVSEIVRELQWHGIKAASRISPAAGRTTAERLGRIAVECGASMLVLGGYGRGPIRETIFGGCTQATLAAAEFPVFLLH